MRRYNFNLVMAAAATLVMASCRTHRESHSESIHASAISRDAGTAIYAEFARESLVEKLTRDSLRTWAHIRIVTYDTSADSDSSGRFPVLQEISMMAAGEHVTEKVTRHAGMEHARDSMALDESVIISDSAYITNDSERTGGVDRHVISGTIAAFIAMCILILIMIAIWRRSMHPPDQTGSFH